MPATRMAAGCGVSAATAEPRQGRTTGLSANRDAVRAKLDESFAAEARGESYSMEEAEAILAKRRAERSASRAA